MEKENLKEINFKLNGDSYKENYLELGVSGKTTMNINQILKSSGKTLKKNNKLPNELKEIELLLKAEEGSFNFKILIKTNIEIEVIHYKNLLKEFISNIRNKEILKKDSIYSKEVETLKKNSKFLNSLDSLLNNIVDLEKGELIISNKIEKGENKDEDSYLISSEEKVEIQKEIFNLLKKEENWRDVDMIGLITKIESNLKKDKKGEKEKRIRKYFFEEKGNRKKIECEFKSDSDFLKKNYFEKKLNIIGKGFYENKDLKKIIVFSYKLEEEKKLIGV